MCLTYQIVTFKPTIMLYIDPSQIACQHKKGQTHVTALKV